MEKTLHSLSPLVFDLLPLANGKGSTALFCWLVQQDGTVSKNVLLTAREGHGLPERTARRALAELVRIGLVDEKNDGERKWQTVIDIPEELFPYNHMSVMQWRKRR